MTGATNDTHANVRFIQMSETEFDEKFELMDSSDDSSVWEWDEVQASGIPKDRIWTWLDGDNGSSCLDSGTHYVNRFGYGVTKEPVEEGIAYSVTMDGPDEEDGWDAL